MSSAGSAAAAPGGTASTGIQPGPSGDAFYQPPTPIPGDANGDLIWATQIDAGIPNASAWQVLYRSESVQGQPIAVSGLVIVPAKHAPRAPVLSWAHATTGVGDQCAITKQFNSGLSIEKLLAPLATAQGWTFVATDYEGLGTPGVHPYLVGLSEARGVLDIVRAARQLTDSGVTAHSPVMILGHSQGGGAALFAAEQAATYAPDLDVIGTAAGAPAGDLDLIAAGSWSATAVNRFGPELIAGFHAAYPALPMDAVASASGQQIVAQVATQCLAQIEALALTPAAVGAIDPTKNAAWAAAIHDNTAGFVVPSAPVFIFQGDADTTVPRTLTDLTETDYCKIGAIVQVKIYPGKDHITVIPAAVGDFITFFSARLAGRPATSSCPAA